MRSAVRETDAQLVLMRDAVLFTETEEDSEEVLQALGVVDTDEDAQSVGRSVKEEKKDGEAAVE